MIELRTSSACGCAPDCNGKTCGSDGCGGFCSGSYFAGGCPTGQTCQSGVCCRRDCTNRDCGDDGCGGSCGTCGDDEVCSAARICMSSQPYIPSAPISYYTNSGGLAGAYFGGILSTVAVAAAFMFFTGTGRSHFDRLKNGGFSTLVGADADKDASKSLMKQSTGGGLASASKYGGYGSSSSAPAPAPSAPSTSDI